MHSSVISYPLSIWQGFSHGMLESELLHLLRMEKNNAWVQGYRISFSEFSAWSLCWDSANKTLPEIFSLSKIFSDNKKQSIFVRLKAQNSCQYKGESVGFSDQKSSAEIPSLQELSFLHCQEQKLVTEGPVLSYQPHEQHIWVRVLGNSP